MMGNQPNASTLLTRAQAIAWEIAIERVAHAKAIMDQFYQHEVRPVCSARGEEGALTDQASAAEDAAYVLVKVHHDALRDMVLTPTPTLAALSFKIEAAHADNVFEGGYVTEAIGAVLFDLRALEKQATPCDAPNVGGDHGQD